MTLDRATRAMTRPRELVSGPATGPDLTKPDRLQKLIGGRHGTPRIVRLEE